MVISVENMSITVLLPIDAVLIHESIDTLNVALFTCDGKDSCMLHIKGVSDKSGIIEYKDDDILYDFCLVGVYVDKKFKPVNCEVPFCCKRNFEKAIKHMNSFIVNIENGFCSEDLKDVIIKLMGI